MATAGVVDQAWPLLAREDLVPGRAPTLHLSTRGLAVTTDDPHLRRHRRQRQRRAPGHGGRRTLAETYRIDPFGLVVTLGDICYYGHINDRFDDVFVKPMAPLIDAGVRFELAVGNHDGRLYYRDETLAEVEDTLELLGTPARYYATTNGPVDLFYLDSSPPGPFGLESSVQLEWLDDALASSTNQWKSCACTTRRSPRGHGATPGPPTPSGRSCLDRRRPGAGRPRPPLRADGRHRRHHLRGERRRLQDHGVRPAP